MKVVLFHLPGIGVVLILGIFVLIDAGMLKAFRTESTFGWMLVVWYPLAAVLGVIQIVLWIRWVFSHFPRGK